MPYSEKDRHLDRLLAQELPFDLPDDWPEGIGERYRVLFSFDPGEVEGRGRLGDLAFSELPPILERIRRLARDLAQERWEDLPPSFADQALPAQLDQLNGLLEELKNFTLEQSDPTQARNELVGRLQQLSNWFRENVGPRAISARARRAAASEVGGDESLNDLQDLRESLDQLRRENAELSRELDSRADLVKGLRQVTGEDASDELAGVFRKRANDLGVAAGKWRTALVVSGFVALIGAVAAFLALKPESEGDTFTASDLGSTTLLLLIVGLLVFGVRVCAQGFRSNRHLQAVAESKAAALSTFTRFSSAIAEEEIRAAVALALAQAVFAVEDTGLVDSANDQVTLIERAVAPRLTASSS